MASVGPSYREIYAKAQSALEDLAEGKDGNHAVDIADMFWEPEDVVSLQDLVVPFLKAMPVLRYSTYDVSVTDHHLCCAARDMLWLVKPVPVEEELLPPVGLKDMRIWEVLAAAHVQRMQLCVFAAYAPFSNAVSNSASDHQIGLPEDNTVVKSIRRNLKDLQVLCREQRLRLVSQTAAPLSAEFKTRLSHFDERLHMWCQHLLRQLSLQEMPLYISQGSHSFLAQVLIVAQNRLEEMEEYTSRLAAEAQEIAVEVAKLPAVSPIHSSSEVSLASFTIIPATAGNPAAQEIAMQPQHLAEVGSMASGHSHDSQMSCLSGHGGPHCFLPSYLFEHSESELSSPTLVSAKDRRLQT